LAPSDGAFVFAEKTTPHDGAGPGYPPAQSEVWGPAPRGAPCTDWNLRSVCGLNDSFVEVVVPEGKSLAGWQLQVEEGISETLACQYTYRIDNWTWPLKVIWLDQFEDETGENVCTTFPITGLVHLLDDTEALIDSRWYTEVMTAGNAWAADDWDDPEGTWSESTPSPGH
jgi:hypothetical protein